MSSCRKDLPVLAAALCLFLSTSASAASFPLPTEDEFFAEIPRVTTAARLEKSQLEAGISVTVIDREMIEASAAIEIPDLLRLVPGFQVAHATGAVFAVGYHGASDQFPRRMEVMVDGRSVYLATNSAVDWAALGIAIDDIERIEVVRGPNSPTFGSNAVFGSINIVTRAPFLLSGRYLRLTGGAQDTQIGVARWGGNIGDWETSLTAQYRADDGFDNVNDHKRLADLRLRADQQVSMQDTFSVQFGLTDGKVGADGQNTYFEPFRDRKIRSHFQMLDWSRAAAEGGQYRLKLYHQYAKADDGYAPDISAFGYPVGTTLPLGLFVATTEPYDLEFQHSLKPREQWRLAWGLGGRHDEIDSELMLGERNSVDRLTGRAFGSLEVKPFESLSIGIDVLTELHEGYGPETSSRAGVNWLTHATRSFRASASRSYRVFNLLERFIDYRLVASNGTPIDNDGDGMADALITTDLLDDFTPERVTAYELGYTQRWTQPDLLLDVRLFREQLDSSGASISPQGDEGTQWVDDAGGWTTKGIDLQLDFRATRSSRVVGAYSYAKLDGRIGNQLNTSGNFTGYEELDDTIPRHTLALMGSHRFDRNWRGSLTLLYVDDMRWRGEGSEVDAYTRLDLKVSRALDFGATDGQLSLIVQNLTGDTYHEFRDPSLNSRDGNEFDRRAYLQVRLDLD